MTVASSGYGSQKAWSAIRRIKTCEVACFVNAGDRQKARSAIRCIKTGGMVGFKAAAAFRESESMEQHKVGGVVAVYGAQHQPGGMLLSHAFADRLFADG